MTTRIALTSALFCLLLLAACAKKPAPQTTAAPVEPPPASAAAAVRETPVQDSVPDVPVTSVERVFFEFDSYLLSAEARATLAQNARLFQADPARTVVIEGHCDERGADEYNLALGEKRARAVLAYLTALGVPARNLSVVSYGEERPLDPAGDESAWAKNRRAEFR